MANSLNIDITDKIVVLNPIYYDQPYLFHAEGGFGCSPNTSGNCVGGFFLVDNERARVEGYQILRLATNEEIEHKCISVKSLRELYLKKMKEATILVEQMKHLMQNLREMVKVFEKEGDDYQDLIESQIQLTDLYEEKIPDQLEGEYELSKYKIENLKTIFKDLQNDFPITQEEKVNYDKICNDLNDHSSVISMADSLIYSQISIMDDEELTKNSIDVCLKLFETLNEKFFQMIFRFSEI